MCVSIFSTNFSLLLNVCGIFHSKKWLRYDQKNMLVCMKSTCYSFDILMKIEFTWQFFNHIIFHETSSNGSRNISCRWTDVLMDRHDESHSRFHYFAYVPNDENLGWYDIYILLTAIGLTPSGSSTVHIYTQRIHRTTQWNRIPRTYITINIHKCNNMNT